MKMKIVGCIMVIVFVAVIAFNANLNIQNDTLSDITLANVEALADNESSTIECPGGSSECARVTYSGGTKIFYKN